MNVYIQKLDLLDLVGHLAMLQGAVMLFSDLKSKGWKGDDSNVFLQRSLGRLDKDNCTGL